MKAEKREELRRDGLENQKTCSSEQIMVGRKKNINLSIYGTWYEGR
jgi:hypothetical protein